MEATKIHPLTLRVMDEIGISLEGQRSKRVREYLGKLAVHDLIVVCARTERECPKLFPGALNDHFWPFPDPAAVDGPLDAKLAAKELDLAPHLVAPRLRGRVPVRPRRSATSEIRSSAACSTGSTSPRPAR
jgi:protein-tyrosine-phosphatase